MRRADRLIHLLSLLKTGEVARGDGLAAALEVSLRTVYRDIAALQAQGFPIDGQAGVGYLLRAPVDLPALSFDHDEMEALALGLAYAAEVGDPDLRAAALTVQQKLDRTWRDRAPGPPSSRGVRVRQRPERSAPAFAALLRRAIRERREATFTYVDRLGRRTRRRTRPLALTAFSYGWLLIGWCVLRSDFRVFRLDRIDRLKVSQACFQDEHGQTLADYLQRRRPTFAPTTPGYEDEDAYEGRATAVPVKRS